MGLGSNPTLGVTSIQKAPHINKPQRQQPSGGCPSTVSAPAHTISLSDGTIWITQAYLILDEIEFHFTKGPGNEGFEPISGGPFAIDLTVTDPLVPENIKHSIAAGSYVRTKLRFKSIDETDLPKNLGRHLEVFVRQFLGSSEGKKTSILMNGCLQKSGSGDTIPFRFITDGDWRLKVDFFEGKTVNPGRQDIIFLADLKAAFLDSIPSVSDLIDELLDSGGPLQPKLMDGRLTSQNSPIAQSLAKSIPVHFSVFTQEAGSFEKAPGLASDAEAVSLPPGL